MKSLHLTTYRLYRPGQTPPLRLAVFSDLHFSYQVTTERLAAILELFRQIHPSYILCPGDLVDYLNLVDDSDLPLTQVTGNPAAGNILSNMAAGNTSDSTPAAQSTTGSATPASERARLLHWIKSLAEVAPLLVSLGNHDVYRRTTPEQEKTMHKHWLIERYSSLFEEIDSLTNVHVLDNNTFTAENLMVLGLTLTSKYYKDSARNARNANVKNNQSTSTKTDAHNAKNTHGAQNIPGENNIGAARDAKNSRGKTAKNTLLHPASEDKSELLRTLDQLPDQFLYHLPRRQLKLALIHSPVHLTDPAVQQKLTEYDYFISGHMHNGVIPPGLDELLPSQRGFISPTRNLFAARTRRTLKTYQDKLIVGGAVTTFDQHSGLIHHLNVLFPSYLSLLEFTTDPICQSKPYIRRQYLNFGEKPKL